MKYNLGVASKISLGFEPGVSEMNRLRGADLCKDIIQSVDHICVDFPYFSRSNPSFSDNHPYKPIQNRIQLDFFLDQTNPRCSRKTYVLAAGAFSATKNVVY